MSRKATNVTWQSGQITHEDRCRITGVQNKVIWFTGLSGSGKSTLARALERVLIEQDVLCYVLDGDNVRHGLNHDLGFSPKDREENIRRIGEVAALFYDAGITVLVGFISPYRKDRQQVRDLIGKDFVEVFVDCPLEECARRDPKGLYEKAIRGDIKEFTGVSAPYEPPENPELVLDTSALDVRACVMRIMQLLSPVHDSK